MDANATQVKELDEAETNVQKIYSKLLDMPEDKIDVGDTLAGYKVEGAKTILWTERAPRLLEIDEPLEKPASEQDTVHDSET